MCICLPSLPFKLCSLNVCHVSVNRLSAGDTAMIKKGMAPCFKELTNPPSQYIIDAQKMFTEGKYLSIFLIHTH